ncbi:MAG: hypothetical protein V7L00_28410 [Nostoc sp.]|uniref:hypothetical protein n=1 Tax=Nostoc sp. TaxID=1180 RepID=UPI002FF6D27B
MSGKNQATGEKVKGCHLLRAASCRAGTCSAAPIAQNEFSLNSAIANQTQEQGQVEQANPPSLLVENSVLGVEIKADHEGQSSAAPVPNPEKWSHEAIVARANMRPERMQKLKAAGNSGQNPGFYFCRSVGVMIPRKQIAIKKLLAKFPQWGIAIVDGVLIRASIVSGSLRTLQSKVL